MPRFGGEVVGEDGALGVAHRLFAIHPHVIRDFSAGHAWRGQPRRKDAATQKQLLEVRRFIGREQPVAFKLRRFAQQCEWSQWLERVGGVQAFELRLERAQAQHLFEPQRGHEPQPQHRRFHRDERSAGVGQRR